MKNKMKRLSKVNVYYVQHKAEWFPDENHYEPCTCFFCQKAEEEYWKSVQEFNRKYREECPVALDDNFSLSDEELPF